MRATTTRATRAAATTTFAGGGAHLERGLDAERADLERLVFGLLDRRLLLEERERGCEGGEARSGGGVLSEDEARPNSLSGRLAEDVALDSQQRAREEEGKKQNNVRTPPGTARRGRVPA